MAGRSAPRRNDLLFAHERARRPRVPAEPPRPPFRQPLAARPDGQVRPDRPALDRRRRRIGRAVRRDVLHGPRPVRGAASRCRRTASRPPTARRGSSRSSGARSSRSTMFRLPVRFWRRCAFGSSLGGDRIEATFEREWPKIRREIDEGRLAMLGLIRVAGMNPFKLTGNHQVIAYGYAEDGRGVTLRIYDPNWPDSDDVTAVLRLDEALRPTSLESVDRRTAPRLLPRPVQARRPPRLALTRAARAPAALSYSFGSSWASVWAPANRSPSSATRSTTLRIVNEFGRSDGSSSSSQPIGAETGAPGRRPHGVRRDERLDERVLGVVEPGPALALADRSTPTTRGRAPSPRSPATAARPRRSCRGTCTSARSAARPGCRACRSASGRPRTPRCSNAAR